MRKRGGTVVVGADELPAPAIAGAPAAPSATVERERLVDGICDDHEVGVADARGVAARSRELQQRRRLMGSLSSFVGAGDRACSNGAAGESLHLAVSRPDVDPACYLREAALADARGEVMLPEIMSGDDRRLRATHVAALR